MLLGNLVVELVTNWTLIVLLVFICLVEFSWVRVSDKDEDVILDEALKQLDCLWLMAFL